MVLSKEDFLRVKLKEEKLRIEELDGEVVIKQLSAKEQAFAIERFQKRIKEDNVNSLAWRETLLVRALHDEQGRIFGDGDEEIIAALPDAIVSKLYSVALRLNPIGDDEKEEEELKNSEAPSTDSSTP